MKELFADDHGIYVNLSSIKDKNLETVWNLVYCNICEKYTSVDINGRCKRCGNKPTDKRYTKRE